MNRRTFIGSTARYLGSLTTLAALSPLAVGAPAQPAMTLVEDIPFPDNISLAGQHLVLNGAGVRYKLVFKMYALGLYLPQKSTSVDEILDMPGPKRVRMVALRDVPMSEFGRLTARGIQAHATREDFVKILPDIARIGELYSSFDRAFQGDEVLLDWLPGTGMVVHFRGEKRGDPFVEPELFRTILKIWLGDKPADVQLKAALLGHDDAAKPLQDPGDILN